MKKLYILLSIVVLFYGVFNGLNAQNNVTVTPVSSGTATQLLVGNSSGVQISNITYSGHPMQLGHFTGAGSYIGINEGIVLATGDCRLAATTNRGSVSCVYTDAYLNDGTHLNIGHSFRAEVSLNSGYSDSDLDLLGGAPHNSAVLEFDFIPNSNSISFEFIFASEEYEEWVHTQYNDVFGFFVSGGNISGPYSNNGVNIAVVPNTSYPISINTINQNTNSQYYIQNVCNQPNNPPGCPNGCCPCPEPDFQYDGFTTALTAFIDGLECDITYHMRIGITNIADDRVGSAVFLKAGSFQNNFVAGPVHFKPGPVCEDDPLTLWVEGSADYEYTWTDAQGQVVSNDQNFTITATPTGPPYTVLVTDPSTGCNKTFAADPTVHVQVNEKPYTKGINNNGDFEYYVPADVPFSFNIYSFDEENENINLSIISLPTSLSYIPHSNLTLQGANQPYIQINGVLNFPGEYIFQVELEDDNICGAEHETYTFKIIVLCPDCIGNVYYEKRGLNTAAYPLLPAITEAQGNIVAGYSVDPAQTDGNVYITPGAGTVEFYAGASVNLQPGFIVEPGGHFIAEVKNICDDNCNDCCEQWQGFTISQNDVPDVFSPNNDGINDYWYVPDTAHSNCAFGITGFHLSIYNREGALVHDVKNHTGKCCYYKAPGPLQPNLQFSNIFWDGRVNWPAVGGPYVNDGVYNWVLTLYGCGSYKETWSGYMHVYAD